MQITANTAVTLHYHITELSTGKPLDSGHVAYLHGGYDNVYPKVEAALEGQSVGIATTVELDLPDAFGPRDPALARVIDKKDFPPGVKVGGQLEGHDDQGRHQVFTVVKIKGDTVHLDGNHPLAGQTLTFQLKVLDVKAASAEEIAHGHAHGAHGHHH